MRLSHQTVPTFLFLNLLLFTVTVVNAQDNNETEIFFPVPEGGWEYDNCQAYNYGSEDLSLRGSEDIDFYKDAIYFVAAGMQGPNGGGEDRSNVTEPYLGGIYFLDLSDKTSPALQRATLSGLPAGLNFRPHGIFYDSVSNRLLVISHNEQDKEENVIIFTVEEEDSGELPTLVFQVALYSDEWVPVGGNTVFWTINDLVVAGPNEFLVTQFAPFNMEDPTPKFIWSCALEESYDAGEEDNGRVKTACVSAVDFVSIGWNGIAISDTRDVAWVSDLTGSQLVEIKKNEDIPGNWTVSAVTPTPGLIDNIVYIDGTLHMASPVRYLTFDPVAWVGSYLVATTSDDQTDSTLQIEPMFQFDPVYQSGLDFPFSPSIAYPVDELLVFGATEYPGVVICSKGDSQEVTEEDFQDDLDVTSGGTQWQPFALAFASAATAAMLLELI